MPSMGNKKLEEYAAGRKAAPRITQGEVELDYLDEIVSISRMAVVAASIPRRKGFDASSQELRADKKVSRVIGQTYFDLWKRYRQAGWLGEGRPQFIEDWRDFGVDARNYEESRIAGSSIVWKDWIPNRQGIAETERSRVARYALDLPPLEREWAIKMCVLRTWELNGLGRAWAHLTSVS